MHVCTSLRQIGTTFGERSRAALLILSTLRLPQHLDPSQICATRRLRPLLPVTKIWYLQFSGSWITFDLGSFGKRIIVELSPQWTPSRPAHQLHSKIAESFQGLHFSSVRFRRCPLPETCLHYVDIFVDVVRHMEGS